MGQCGILSGGVGASVRVKIGKRKAGKFTVTPTRKIPSVSSTVEIPINYSRCGAEGMSNYVPGGFRARTRTACTRNVLICGHI